MIGGKVNAVSLIIIIVWAIFNKASVAAFRCKGTQL